TRLKEKIEVYQRRVESTPKREQELAGLTRDYTITQQNYQRLLDRYYESKRAESMEKRQQGEQFRILDFAKPPQTPVSPDKTRIALVFLALGLGAGAGILFLFELADRSIKDSARLEVISGGIPCISSVPLALTQYDRKRLRWRNILLIVLNLAIFCLGVFLVIYSRMAHIVVDIPFPL
ncbi:MAG: GNVR domain-containing protein, partial [Thermodesulfobacteriota bacterium]|nr:GNVR domain-containing protein [Thermodesulfobacteriota bacterium]